MATGETEPLDDVWDEAAAPASGPTIAPPARGDGETEFDYRARGGMAQLLDEVFEELDEEGDGASDDPEPDRVELVGPKTVSDRSPLLDRQPPASGQATILIDAQQLALDHAVASSVRTGVHRAPSPEPPSDAPAAPEGRGGPYRPEDRTSEMAGSVALEAPLVMEAPDLVDPPAIADAKLELAIAPSRARVRHRKPIPRIEPPERQDGSLMGWVVLVSVTLLALIAYMVLRSRG